MPNNTVVKNTFAARKVNAGVKENKVDAKAALIIIITGRHRSKKVIERYDLKIKLTASTSQPTFANCNTVEPVKVNVFRSKAN